MLDQDEFNRLFLHNDGFQNYFNLVRSIQGAVPVLVRCDGDCQFLDSQIDRALELDRGLVVRVERGRLHHVEEVLERLTQRTDDLVFVVDAGWSKDILLAQPWTHAMVNLIRERNAEAEIILASSSFPSSFSHLGARGLSSIDDRELYRRIRQSTNANLIYGDWGSTRPSNEATPMKAVPRIDLAHSGEWLSFRRVGTEDYQAIARRLVADPAFDHTVDSWGKALVERLAGGDVDSLKGTSKATSARINMHLTAQARFGEGIPLPEETPYTDPF